MSNVNGGSELLETVRKLVTPGKGVLAADESTSTAGKRLASVNLPNTEDNRRAFREMLFTSSGAEQYISGVILYEETLFQAGSSGAPLVSLLAERGILAGIKADIGLVPLPGSPAETMTQGLDNLQARCERYYAAGARFAKWRAVITIDAARQLPSSYALQTAAEGLAKYAAMSQAAGLVPIVEPEVLSDGTHSIGECEAVTHKVLSIVFRELQEAGVQLEAALLKPSMVLPGSGAPKAAAADVAAATLRVLQRTVPPALPGILFLSGGQSEEDATLHLALINQLPGPKPWYVSFSYGRALQSSALKAWAGSADNVAAAQQMFLARAAANSAATLGHAEAAA